MQADRLTVPKKNQNIAWVPDVMRNQELEKVLEVNTKIEIN